MRDPVELYQVLVLCVLLSCAASWIIAHRYRRRMQQLMRAPGPGDSRPSNAPVGQAHNAGCRYEFATLAQASRKLRVVILTDGRTDRTVAQEAIASGRHERFTWLEVSHFNASKLREVLAHLFA